MVRDDSKYGYDSDGQNFYLKLHHEFQKMVLISFQDLKKSKYFSKVSNVWLKNCVCHALLKFKL